MGLRDVCDFRDNLTFGEVMAERGFGPEMSKLPVIMRVRTNTAVVASVGNLCDCCRAALIGQRAVHNWERRPHATPGFAAYRNMLLPSVLPLGIKLRRRIASLLRNPKTL